MNLQDEDIAAESWLAKAFSWSVARVVAHPKVTACIAFALLIIEACRIV